MSDPAPPAPAATDPFEHAYARGVTTEQAPPARSAPTAQPAATGQSSAAEPLALRGCVVTPETVFEQGYVVIGPDGTVTSVQGRAPQGARVIETGGVIAPGLIDLHNHPEFNIFGSWEPPQLFANRYEWRASPIYQRLVRDPEHLLLKELPALTQSRYAEIRALTAGVTAIQGSSSDDDATNQPIIRHVDLWNFGAHTGRSMIDLPLEGSPGVANLQAILGLIASGDVTAFYLHLAEGRSDDPTSLAEFPRLLAMNALTPATILIHGVALTVEQLGQVGDAGAKMVWSPQSNLRLYDETTPAAEALRMGVPMAIGADWAPSGSTSLLAELKVARRLLLDQGLDVNPKVLVEMVTSRAAAIAGLSGHVGTLTPGKAADIVVLERRLQDPWENIIEADPSWIDLVMVNGNFSYGRADWAPTALPAGNPEWQEKVTAWGKRMVLDTNAGIAPDGNPLPTLAQLRASLIAFYPQVGPIFA